jgi:replication-associated recombination protein RarA
MVQPISTQSPLVTAPQGRVASMILWGAAGIGGFALCAAVALWFHYGTAVFFEMITAGISACF